MIVIAILISCISLSFSFILSFLILKSIHATDLMWFLYWINLPFVLVLNILNELIKREITSN
jgi:ABC-type phosphate/phosphonate transport system permease subunit